MSKASEGRAPSEERLSVCLFCGSSSAARPEFQASAAQFGEVLAKQKVRLVYGGGGIGLMGAAARSAHSAGGAVLGVMPEFLRRREVVYDVVETVVVETMHDRKRIMFENADGFAIFPGGVGTLEEVVELMSWRRLDLHRKPIVFLDLNGFWGPLFALIRFMVDEKFAPAWIEDTWTVVPTVEEVLPAILRMRAQAHEGPGFFGYDEQNTQVAEKL